jgi:hypothetical protein
VQAVPSEDGNEHDARTTMAQPEHERLVRLILTPDEHLKFRQYAASQDKPMSAVARQVLTRFMAEKGISRGETADRRPGK